MAPGKSSKQSLLDLSVFLKQPSKAVLKKRKKLEKEMKPFIRGKASVDRKKEARIKREKEIEKGSREWHQFLVASGVTNVKRSETELLYLANGCKPPVPTLEELDDVEEDSSQEKEDDDFFFDTIDDV